MPKLFGTDGVRGVANQDLTPDLVLALGRAAGSVLAPNGGWVVVGRDTRLSGPMLEAALVAGLTAAGADVLLTGVIPTPAVSFLCRDVGRVGGAVISASHNPVPDNGVKFFSDTGYKITAGTEDAIEDLLVEPGGARPTGSDVGSVERLEDAESRYAAHLMSTMDEQLRVRVVLDCAHGAAYSAGPAAFRAAGADVIVMHDEPDGARINVDCGSTNLAAVGRRVVEEGADLGLAFDGDADRVLAVDERGEEIDGDRIMGLLADELVDREGDRRTVVVTVMSNLGFRRALEERGLEVVITPVGDRFVAEAMKTTDAVIGGEQSGHVIFGAHSSTGDGILTGLHLAHIASSRPDPLSKLAHFFEPFPQVLLNVPVTDKGRLDAAADVWAEVEKVEGDLGADGRVLVRESGTEPLVRVMVEASNEDLARSAAERLAAVVRAQLA